MNTALLHNVLRRPAWAGFAERSATLIVLFYLGHIVFAYAAFRSSAVAAVHGLAVLLLGLRFALDTRNTARVAYVLAYIAGAEILWRMARATLLWEFGKYATVLIVAVALFHARRVRIHKASAAAFALLLPSAALTITYADLNMARKLVSFNLSGPLALAACVWFFYNVRLTKEQLCRTLLMLMAPLPGVITVAVVYMNSKSRLNFSGESNFATSGGFGPNQVSGVLGLGVLLAFLCLVLLDRRTSAVLKAMLFVCMLAFAAQSAMTFSRGGLYCAAGAAGAACLCLAGDSRKLQRILPLGILFLLAAGFIILPRLQEFTGGALVNRFKETDLTNRDLLIRDDLRAWLENPVLGAGPGLSNYKRSFATVAVAGHTEFSRLLAEHGFLGLFSGLTVLLMGLNRYRMCTEREERALVLAAFVWSVLFMLVNAMRVVAPSFMFGLAMLSLKRPIPVGLRFACPTVVTRVQEPRCAR